MSQVPTQASGILDQDVQIPRGSGNLIHIPHRKSVQRHFSGHFSHKHI